MSDVTKIKIARVFASAAFWIAVGVLFFGKHGVSLIQALQLISIHYIAYALLEIPTGIVGDHFSHKLSVILGNLIAGVAIFSLILGSGFGYYVVVMVVIAVGITLISGSDTALLHSLSKDFRKDQSQVKFWTTLVVVAATTVGSLLAVVNINLPFALTGIANILAGIFVMSVHASGAKSKEGNIFRTALATLHHVRGNKAILHLLLIYSAALAFIVSANWFYNPLLQRTSIPLAYWGVILGVSLLTPLLGIRFYQKRRHVNIMAAFVLFALSITSIGVLQIAAVSIAALWISGMLGGYLDAATDVALNDTIGTAQRAGILSLGSLLSRLGSSAYIPLVGVALDGSWFLLLMLITGVTLLTLCGYSLLFTRRLPALRAA